MIDNTNMSNSEMLHAFIDGELSSGESNSLFLELAHNSELQEEMQQLLAIKGSLKNSQVVPPESLKTSILEKAALDDAAIASQSWMSSLASGNLVRNTAFFLLLIGVGITSIWLVNSESSNNLASDFGNNNLDRNIAFVSSLEDTGNTIISSENDNSNLGDENSNIVNNGNRVGLSTKSKSNLSEDNNLTNSDKNKENLTSNADSKTSFFGRLFNSEFHNNQHDINLNGDNEVDSRFKNYVFAQGLGRYLQNFSVTFRTNYMASNPSFNLENASDPLLNNFGLSLAYNVNENHSFGIEVGQENFLMQYEGYGRGIDNEQYFRFRQDYNAFWGGLFYQYTMDGLSSIPTIRPYGRATLGATEVGPIVRFGLGTYYNISSNTALQLGVENANLFYNYLDNSFITNKIGVTAGVVVNF